MAISHYTHVVTYKQAVMVERLRSTGLGPGGKVGQDRWKMTNGQIGGTFVKDAAWVMGGQRYYAQ
jgi:hypothetical protein